MANAGSNPVRANGDIMEVMTVRDLVEKVGLHAKIMVMYDDSEDEIAIEPIERNAVMFNEDDDQVIINLRWYPQDIYVDSDQ